MLYFSKSFIKYFLIFLYFLSSTLYSVFISNTSLMYSGPKNFYSSKPLTSNYKSESSLNVYLSSRTVRALYQDF